MTPHPRSRLHRRLIALFVVPLLMFGACGDDNDDGADPTSSTMAAGPSGNDDAASGPEGTLRVGTVALGSGGGLIDMLTGDAAFALSLVQEHLVMDGPDQPTNPGLAKEFYMNDDGSQVTFILEEGVQFHDDWGEFTAADVEFTIQELIDREDSPATLSAYFRDKVESIETPDDYTVILNIKEGAEDFAFFDQIKHNFPRLPIASKAYVEEVGRDAASEHWIGTGPWRFVEFQQGNFARFEAVEDHWRQTPAFKELILVEVPEPATQVLQLESGDLDIINVSLDSLERIEGAGFNVFSSTGHPFWVFFGGMYVPERASFDPSLPWVADPADEAEWDRARTVRLAMNYAVDKDAVFEAFLGGRGERTAVPAMLPSYPGYDASWESVPYDPDRAVELLEEAGYPDGFPVTVRLYRLGGREAIWEIGEAVGDYWSQIGLDVTLEPVDYSGVQSVDQRDRTLRSIGTYALYRPEALGSWTIFGTTTAGPNWLPEHPELDDLIGRGSATFDLDERLELTQEIAQWYIDEAATIPIGSNTINFAANPDKVGDWLIVPAMTNPAVNLEYITKP